MSFSKNISSKKMVCVLDFGADTVSCLIGSRKEGKDGSSFHIAGAANGRVRGVKDGEVVHVADAAESVVAPFKKAVAAAGMRPDTVYFAFDDALIQSSLVSGFKALSGEGEIDLLDVRQASDAALRMVGDFERKTVYFKPLSFTIDDQDVVTDPLGIFGKKLEAQLLVIQARSMHFDAWSRVMERAGIDKAVPVLSAWATACGILSKERRSEGALVVDLGRDFINIFEVGYQRIRRHKVLLASEGHEAEAVAEQIADFFKANDAQNEIWITGDQAENADWIASIEKATGRVVRPAKPTETEELGHPRHATLAGLLSVADESEKTPVLHKDRGLFANVKEKATSFLSEYF